MTQQDTSTVIAEPDGVANVFLPESPTTGYRWELEDPQQSKHLVSASFGASGNRAGDGGTRLFRVDLQGLEAIKLVFILRRPWETAVLKRHIVVVAKGPDEAPH